MDVASQRIAGGVVTLPIDHVVLASAAVKWEPPPGVDYVMLSALYDPEAKTMRLVFEGCNSVGVEVRTVLYWDAGVSEWIAADYQRLHAMFVPIDWHEDEETTR